jgi:hypothetical protein
LPLYQIPARRYTDADGNIVDAVVDAAAQSAVAKGHYLKLESARDVYRRAATFEQWNIADKLRRNAEYDAKVAADENEARKIAAEHNFNIETLSFEVNRRSFGSFTTTPDGSPERRAIYARALEIARAEQRSHHLEAAE